MEMSHMFVVFSGVVAACPESCPQWQTLELSGSCLSFPWPGWPGLACQSLWWSLADIQYNLLGAVRLTHISPLTSSPRCLLKSWQTHICYHPGLLGGASMVWVSRCWTMLCDQFLTRRGESTTQRQIMFPGGWQASKQRHALLSVYSKLNFVALKLKLKIFSRV